MIYRTEQIRGEGGGGKREGWAQSREKVCCVGSGTVWSPLRYMQVQLFVFVFLFVFPNLF